MSLPNGTKINVPIAAIDNLTLRLSTPSDLLSLLTLENTVYENLKHRGKERFIAKTTKQNFEQALSDDSITLIGLFKDNKAVATAAVQFPDKEFEPFCPIDHLDIDVNKIAFLKGIRVHPEMQGEGIAKLLIKKRIDIARANGRRIAMTETNALNPKSFCNHLKKGGRIVSAGNHKKHGESILIANPICDNWSKEAGRNDNITKIYRCNTVEMLGQTQHGNFGIGYDRDEQAFLFAPVLFAPGSDGQNGAGPAPRISLTKVFS